MITLTVLHYLLLKNNATSNKYEPMVFTIHSPFQRVKSSGYEVKFFLSPDKNKSLEKETKQSYSEALSAWSQDEITDKVQKRSKKTDGERR